MSDQSADLIAAYPVSTFVREPSRPVTATTDSITLKLENDDIAFVLGKQGVTKQKLAKVSDVRLDIDEKAYTLTITSPSLDKRRKAHEYIDMVLAQRRGGAVQVDLTQPRDDLTVLQVPAECVGYVTGAGGNVLRGLEKEWSTLMFFLNPSRDASGNQTETLVIFGRVRGRLGAALKVMSAVEHKLKGYYVKDGRFEYDFSSDLDADPRGFFMEQELLQEADFSYALGREGKTRKKLAKASGCILEYVGLVAVMIGTLEERTRVKDYLRWLLLQRTGQCDVDLTGRTDVTTMSVEAKYVGWVTGVQGKNFRQIEEDSGCYLFTNRSSGNKLEGDQMEQILIFSYDSRCRERAERAIRKSIEEKKDADAHGSRISRRGESGRRDSYSRRRSRSPPRRRDSSPSRHRGRSEDYRRRRDDSPRRRDDSPRGRRRDDDRGRGRGRSRDRR